MEAYSDFAYVYDTFMDSTPYEEWKNDIVKILKENGIEDGLVLDLGCGTGKMTRLLKNAGYDMIGIDASYDMLNVAMENESQNILYLCQDMREFELYGTVRAIISVCDCVNYLLEDQELIKTFKLVNNYLDSEGIFIFDFNTVHKYRDIIADTTIAENRDDCSFIWENSYDLESRLNEYDVTVFVREDKLVREEQIKNSENNTLKNEDEETNINSLDSDGEDIYEDFMFGRFTEQHIQKAYELNEMIHFIELAGMEFVKAYDTDSKLEADDNSERITIVAREKTVKGKKYK